MNVRNAFFILILAAAACDDTAEPEVRTGEAYELAYVNNQPLPVPAPCYSLLVTGASLLLEPLSRASYRVDYRDPATDAESWFEGTGTYRVSGSTLRVTVEGSVQPAPRVRLELTFAINADGIELSRTGVGAECDGNSTETFLHTSSVLR